MNRYKLNLQLFGLIALLTLYAHFIYAVPWVIQSGTCGFEKYKLPVFSWQKTYDPERWIELGDPNIKTVVIIRGQEVTGDLSTEPYGYIFPVDPQTAQAYIDPKTQKIPVHDKNLFTCISNIKPEVKIVIPHEKKEGAEETIVSIKIKHSKYLKKSKYLGKTNQKWKLNYGAGGLRTADLLCIVEMPKNGVSTDYGDTKAD
ncbi:MAG: hypothetical protein K0R49_329 [Burkholderiales bacterium]|nr:hypothetical protein [Burkholderiales bacterium]